MKNDCTIFLDVFTARNQVVDPETHGIGESALILAGHSMFKQLFITSHGLSGCQSE